MKGFVQNIEALAVKSTDFRRVLYTGKYLQLVLMALKQAEDAADEWILRCYECHGQAAQLDFHSDLSLKLEHPVDLLEQEQVEKTKQGQTASIRPWEIASFKMRMG